MKTFCIAAITIRALCASTTAPGAPDRTYVINGTQYDVTFADPVKTPLGTIAQETVTQHDDQGRLVRQWTTCELQTKDGWTETECPESD